MKRVFAGLLGLLVLLVLYLTLAPIPVAPRAYVAPPSRGYTGPFTRNQRLSALERVALDGGQGPEDAAADAEGRIYVSLRDADIARIDPETRKPERWANTGGMPLGLEFDAQGTLWVADAYRGLVSIGQDGRVAVRSASAEGVPIRYADDVAVTRDGIVYFTDASTKFGARASGGTLPASLLDLMEHGLHGRVLRYDPRTGQTAQVRAGLSFANGLALSEDDALLLVVETGMNRVLGLHLKGPRAGTLEVLIDALPGFPDNIERGQDGRFWVGLVSPRSAALDKLADKPWLRGVVQRLPPFLRPRALEYGHLFAMDERGRVLLDLQDPSGAYSHVTAALETAHGLWVTSLTEPDLGHLPQPGAGAGAAGSLPQANARR